MSLSITDVARHTGVPTSTLRYYDRLGLLESARRGENGYRQYDDRALERLRFIGRAKALGCSLEEIAQLLTAFDRDCGDVEGRLRDLVDGKISIAQGRVMELVALTTQLEEARDALNAEPAVGACGPGCPCLPEETSRVPRPLMIAQPAQSENAIACTLSEEEMDDRVTEWRAVLGRVEARTPIDHGVRLTFGRDVDLADVTRLAGAESACCSFFAFALTIDSRGTALEVRAPESAQTLVASLFGAAA